MLAMLERLVKAETPSNRVDLLQVFADLMEGELRQLAGAQVERIPGKRAGDLLLVRYPGNQEGASGAEAPALVLTHYDTVWAEGTLKRLPFRVEDGRGYGPGIYDMKASLVQAYFAVRSLALVGERLPRPVWWLLTSDEEVGSSESRPVIERLAKQAAYVLVLEPPTANGELKTARKGIGKLLLRVTGKAAHAGTQPELGVSAVHELAHQILRLQAMNDYAAGVTVNVGVVRGGSGRNVIPEQAEAEVDVRAWTPEQARELERMIRAVEPVLAGTKVAIEGGFGRAPMARTPQIAGLFHQAQAIGAQLGRQLGEAASGGGSDANITAALGVATLDGLGIPGNGAHAVNEHILVEALPEQVQLLVELVRQLKPVREG